MIPPARYRLHASPIPDLPISTALAEQFNNHEERYFLRFNATRAAGFYTRSLTLPVTITVERI